MMLPDACLLHAARHPADAGLSCFAQPFEGRGTPWANNLTRACVAAQGAACVCGSVLREGLRGGAPAAWLSCSASPHCALTPLRCRLTRLPRLIRRALCAAGPADIAHQAGLVQALADHWDAVLPGRVLHVRYEDLVRDQVRYGTARYCPEGGQP